MANADPYPWAKMTDAIRETATLLREYAPPEWQMHYNISNAHVAFAVAGGKYVAIFHLGRKTGRIRGVASTHNWKETRALLNKVMERGVEVEPSVLTDLDKWDGESRMEVGRRFRAYRLRREARAEAGPVKARKVARRSL